MIRVIPKWKIDYYSEGELICSFCVSSDFYNDILDKISTIDCGILITSIIITKISQ